MAIDSFMLENGGSVVHARSYRRLLRDLTGRGEGVTSSTACAVSEKSGTPNMSVDVAVGGVVIYGDDGTEQGSFFLYNDAVKNCAVSASDPTNPRYDLVVARVRDSENGVVGDTLTIEIVEGTPAASPAEPATPSSAYVLARVEVLAAATSIVNARITDRRRGAVNANSGMVSCTHAMRPTAPTEGTMCYETDTDLFFVYNGSAWVCVTPKSALVSTNQSTASASYTDLATAGPAVTVETGTKALVTVGALMVTNASGRGALMSCAVSGASTVAAADDYAVYTYSASGGDTQTAASRTFYLSGLTAGSNVFTAKYKCVGSTVNYSHRTITVIGIP